MFLIKEVSNSDSKPKETHSLIRISVIRKYCCDNKGARSTSDTERVCYYIPYFLKPV